MSGPDDFETRRTEAPSTVFEVIEDYVARLRRGEDPKLSEVLEGRTNLEERVREVLSTVLRLEAFAGPDSVVAYRSMGHYEILHELGRGGQGVVYEAIDTRLGRRVAIKVLSSLGPGTEELLLRFRREAEVAARLKHPSLCTVYEAAVEGNVPFIAMELVEGESLRDRVQAAREGAPSGGVTCILLGNEESDGQMKVVDRTASGREPSHWNEIVPVLRLFENCARALHAMHAASVIHRDIKPGNIMVTEDGRPIIMDFGLARVDDLSLSTLTRTGDLFGTPEYMSPEQMSGQTARLDRRTDVWSLGVSLFECLTLERPFQAETRQALSNLILVADPPSAKKLNPSIPRDLEAVLETALEKKVDRRYQTALDLAEELQRVRQRKPVRARPVTRRVRLQRWAQRNPTVAVLLAGLLTVLLVGTVTSLVFASRAKSSAAEAMREKAGVFRLRAFHTLEDLKRRADLDLWPLNLKRALEIQKRVQEYTDWLGDARPLVSGLTEPDTDTGAPSHYAQLAELRKRALPQADADKETDRNTHPRLKELQALEVKLSSWLRAQAVREGRERPIDFVLDEGALPESANGLSELARPLVHPDRKTFGREAEGLAIMRRSAAFSDGEHEVTESCESTCRTRPASARNDEPRQLRQAAGDQPGDRVRSQAQAVGDPHRNGHHVLECPAQLHSDRIAVGVQPEIPRGDTLLQRNCQLRVRRSDDDRGRQSVGHLHRKRRSGQNGRRAVSAQLRGRDVERQLQRAFLDSLRGGDDRSLGGPVRTGLPVNVARELGRNRSNHQADAPQHLLQVPPRHHRLRNVHAWEVDGIVTAIQHSRDQLRLAHPQPDVVTPAGHVHGERRPPRPATDHGDRIRAHPARSPSDGGPSRQRSRAV